MHIKSNDTVMVIRGDDKGRRGKVLSIDHKAGTLVVEGMNRVFKHVKRSQKNPQGGRLSKEMPLRLCNVMLVCEKCDQASRTGARYLEDGSKERYCKACGAGNGVIAPPRAAYARKS
ncbi:MAG: 50S ribosomal protein L24 [Pirellulales bacterium]